MNQTSRNQVGDGDRMTSLNLASGQGLCGLDKGACCLDASVGVLGVEGAEDSMQCCLRSAATFLMGTRGQHRAPTIPARAPALCGAGKPRGPAFRLQGDLAVRLSSKPLAELAQ